MSIAGLPRGVKKQGHLGPVGYQSEVSSWSSQNRYMPESRSGWLATAVNSAVYAVACEVKLLVYRPVQASGAKGGVTSTLSYDAYPIWIVEEVAHGV
jgi:hypothetical protein